MKPFFITAFLAFAIGLAPSSTPAAEEDSQKEGTEETGGKDDLPTTVKEARGRARILTETVHGALQVMHRDFFGDGDEEDLALPSQSLEDVFKELARSWSVEVRWLGVNATKKDDHKPRDDFEKAAAEALLKGEQEYEAVEKNVYRHVGAMTIQNECLKCHVPNRTTLEDRVGGIAINIPLNLEAQN